MNRLLLLIIAIFCISVSLNAQDSNLYNLVIPIKPITQQQKSNVEDSIMRKYSDLKRTVNGHLPISNVNKPAAVPKKQEHDLYYRYNYDFYATLMYQKSVNNNPDDETELDNLMAYYNLTLNATVKIKKFKWTSYFFNEYGYRKIIDSTGGKQEDLFYFKNNFSYDIIKNKLAYTLMTNIKSQFWPTYRYRLNSTTDEFDRYLYSAYNSPGYFLFSGGLKYSFGNNSANVELGIAGGKTTKIRNQKLFESREQDVIYKVPKGKKRIVDFGINMQLNLPVTKLSKQLYLENFTLLYMPNKSILKLTSYTLDMNNAVHFLFLKYLRLSFRTKIFYDMEVQEKVKMINQLSLGFYLTNRVD